MVERPINSDKKSWVWESKSKKSRGQEWASLHPRTQCQASSNPANYDSLLYNPWIPNIALCMPQYNSLIERVLLMVTFVCYHCDKTLKKNQVDRHYCGQPGAFICIGSEVELCRLPCHILWEWLQSAYFLLDGAGEEVGGVCQAEEGQGEGTGEGAGQECGAVKGWGGEGREGTERAGRGARRRCWEMEGLEKLN